MKKSNRSLFAIIASSAVLFSCARVEVETPKEETLPEKEVTEDNYILHDVEILAGSSDEETKTYLESDGKDGFVTKWDAEDKIAIFQKLDDEWQTKRTSKGVALTESDLKAAFTVELSEGVSVSNYKYLGVYPSANGTKDGDNLALNIPSEQTFSIDCFDKNGSPGQKVG